jgi:hypothetical protein
MGFMGVTAHWIEVKEGKWKLRASVIGFKALSGAHDGENLGRYLVGVLDCVGILSQKESKVPGISLCHCFPNPVAFTQLYAATLDNTGNNTTTCNTIDNIHAVRGLSWNSAEQQLPCVSLFLVFFCTHVLQMFGPRCQPWEC